LAIPQCPQASPQRQLAIPQHQLSSPQPPLAIPQYPLAVPQHPLAAPQHPLASPHSLAVDCGYNNALKIKNILIGDTKELKKSAGCNSYALHIKDLSILF